MDKREFIDRLRRALAGNLSANLVEENVKYYEDYINSQIRLGFAETDVIETLGEPRFLAKSIIMANSHNVINNKAHQNNTVYTQDMAENEQYSNELRMVRMPKWVAWLVFGLIIFTIVVVITTIIKVLIPIVVPVLLIYFLIKLFRDWLN